MREAERAFAQAIAVARSQGARLLVLGGAGSDEPLASPDEMEANALLDE